MQLTNDRLSLQETENSIVLVSQQLDILLGQDENLLLKPDTTLLHQAVALEAYEDYITLAYTNDPAENKRNLPGTRSGWLSRCLFPAYRCMPQIHWHALFRVH